MTVSNCYRYFLHPSDMTGSCRCTRTACMREFEPERVPRSGHGFVASLLRSVVCRIRTFAAPKPDLLLINRFIHRSVNRSTGFSTLTWNASDSILLPTGSSEDPNLRASPCSVSFSSIPNFCGLRTTNAVQWAGRQAGRQAGELTRRQLYAE